MKKGSKVSNGSNRAIRTLSRKEHPHEMKRNNANDQQTYQNNSGYLLANGATHDRSNS